ncbi:hypothetical protein PM082_021102 [Marasmius tenuissimus]|nr:hypothetical protein PM082_021102 [Marasmius tenuissimus]
MPVFPPNKPTRDPPYRKISLGWTQTSPKKKQAQSNNLLVRLDLQSNCKRELRQQLEQLKRTRQDVVESPSSEPNSTNVSGCKDASGAAGTPSEVRAAVGIRESSPPAGSIGDDETIPSSQASLLEELPGVDFDDFGTQSNPRTPQKPKKIKQRKKKQHSKQEIRDEPGLDVVARWKTVLESLVDPLLKFKERTLGQPNEQDSAPPLVCSGSCMVEETAIRFYSFHHHRVQSISHCRCQTLTQSLVLRGFFPTAPSQPRMAIAIHLLEFYQALCEQSSDAVTALAGALEVTYRWRGLPLLDSAGKLMKDPLRRSLGQALQWYDILASNINRKLDNELEGLKATLPPLRDTVTPLPQPLAISKALSLVPQGESTPSARVDIPAPEPASVPPSAPLDSDNTTPPSPTPRTSQDRCSGYLQRLCPACFGGNSFGKSFDQGGDIHVALDGNFHHRHLKSGGDGVDFYESYRFLTKAEVDKVGERIDAARQKPPKPRQGPVPDDIVDADGKAYKAARGESQQTQSKRFDKNGVMALVSRHDIPLLAASIDTPGEQQKFTIALLEEFFGMLPADATVAVLYDIACVIDRSVHIYDILDEQIVSRIVFATAIMHAYGHQWSCQLHYNPRLRKGLGLTDGEGTERLWSALRKLIGLERRSSRARRIWLLDRQCDAIAQKHRDDLGAYISRKLFGYVQKKEADAIKTLRSYKIPLEELQALWKEQREAQTSCDGGKSRFRSFLIYTDFMIV